MILRKAIYLAVLFCVVILASCSSDNDSSDSESSMVEMPVSLTIPSTDGPVTRAGDPGTYEHFKLPRYAYIYIVFKNAEGNDVVVRSTPTLSDNWTKTDYNGSLASNGDSVYQYNGRIRVFLPVSRPATAKAYVALSTVPLQGLPTGNESYSTEGETESTVLNYKYQITDEVNGELANIYSSPYNYRPDGTNYYGTIYKFDDLTPSLDLVLYHAASKLDLTWNVDEAVQDTLAIDSMTLSLPSANSVYIFRPLETVQEDNKTRNISIPINKGNQWYGRDYEYITPILDNNSTYNFGLTVKTVQGTIRRSPERSFPFSDSSPFTPWIRAMITIGSK